MDVEQLPICASLRGEAGQMHAAGQALLVSSHAVCWIDEPGVMGFEISLGRRTVTPDVAARRNLGLAS